MQYVNWSMLLLKLRAMGYKTSQVHRELCINYAHLQRLSDGSVSEPRFSSGLKLLEYAKQRLGDTVYNELVDCDGVTELFGGRS